MAIVKFLPRKVSLIESTSAINVAEWISGSDGISLLSLDDWSFEPPIGMGEAGQSRQFSGWDRNNQAESTSHEGG